MASHGAICLERAIGVVGGGGKALERFADVVAGLQNMVLEGREVLGKRRLAEPLKSRLHGLGSAGYGIDHGS